MPLSILLNLSLPMLRALLKNPVATRKMQNLCLQVFEAIKAAYADDESFL